MKREREMLMVMVPSSWFPLAMVIVVISLPLPGCGTSRAAQPTTNALLINFLLSSDAENLFNKHRLSMQIGAKRAKDVHAMSMYSD